MTRMLKTLIFFFHAFFRNSTIIHKNKNLSNIAKSEKQENFDIIVYLPTPPSSYYQLAQWLQPLNKLNKKLDVAIVTRKISTFAYVSQNSEIPILYIQRFYYLRKFYKNCSPKIILYVNNSLKNNQSLLYKKGYHIHLNHGESEKESMSSNQSKAYDFVFTVGQRGIDRYKDNLLNFDQRKYLQIGRPQLDFINPIKIESKKKKILYAPTWEAHYKEMDYCSVVKHGLELVKEIIGNPNFIFIYKPHPLIGTQRRSIKKTHNKIKDLINKSNNAYNYEKHSIIDLFDCIDFAFFDNSSVMIDYLFFDKPGTYIEIREDIQSKNIHQAYYSYDQIKDGSNLSVFINNCISKDIKKSQRIKIKEHYLGDYIQGESTITFVSTIDELVKQRDLEIVNKINN